MVEERRGSETGAQAQRPALLNPSKVQLSEPDPPPAVEAEAPESARGLVGIAQSLESLKLWLRALRQH